MSDINWTTSQRRAIDTDGRSILVSAGAGSGKTAVLAERCAHLVLNAAPPCDVNELLVVTFTEAAAAEMRERIGRALRRRAAERPSDHRLQRQLVLLDTARISTIHSFCRNVLNRYFAQADLDPQAPILDPHEATILKRENIQRVFDEWSARTDAEGEQFYNFLAAYGASEDSLQSTILGVNEFLASLPDPEAWLDATLRHASVTNDTTPSEFWLAELRASIAAELVAQAEAVRQESQALRNRFRDEVSLQVLAGFFSCLTHYKQSLMTWSSRLAGSTDPWTLDSICREQIATYEFPDIPRKVKKTYDALPDRAAQAFDAGGGAVRTVRDKLYKPLKTRWTAFDTAGWAAGLRHAAPNLDWLVQLIRQSRDAFQRAKRELGVIDFGDLERFTLNLLRDEANGVAARLRDEFRHVLVDEFQDVNPIQAEIIRRVSREAGDSRADNLFTVGDVKQSIYRFRLAEPRLFLDRQHAFQTGTGQSDSKTPAGMAIDLVENFRSTRPVIDAINALFEKLMAADLGGIEYDEHARLKFSERSEDSPATATDSHTEIVTPPAGVACSTPIELHLLEAEPRAGAATPAPENDDDSDDLHRIEREAYVVAGRIQSLLAEGRKCGDIVVLLRSLQARVHLFTRALSQLGIPVHADTSGGLFDTLEIRDVLALLMVLDNERQDIPLAAVLRSPLLGEPLSDTDLALIRIAAGPEKRHAPFHEAVRHCADDQGGTALRPALRAKLDQLADWRARIRRRPIADVLWEIYDQSGYLAWVSGLKEGDRRQANLIQLHEHARKFGEFHRQGLYRFLQFIEGIRESDGDLDAGNVAPSSGDVVRIMTIHRSKGLEFPVVFVAELGKRFNLRDMSGSILYDRRLGLALEAVDIDRRIVYPTLPHRLVAQANKLEMLSEELRVLYVALTRAKERLILVGTGDDRMIIGAENPPPGPLPLLRRREANCFLNWIIDALESQPQTAIEPGPDFLPGDPPAVEPSSPRSAALFACRSYSLDEIREWRLEAAVNETGTKQLRDFAACLPWTGSVHVPLSTIGRLSRRLSTPYPAAALTQIPAVAAASILKRRWNTLTDDAEPAGFLPAREKKDKTEAEFAAGLVDFREPSFASQTLAPTATRRGTLTHEFLQRVDLTRASGLSELKAQLEAMTASNLFTPDDSSAIDLDAIAWFFTTGPGRAMCHATTRVLREWPFVLGVDPSRYDPAAAARSPDDVLLVRGIIDCLYDTGDGWQVLDYKTDRLTPAEVADRASFYRGQLEIYAAAMEAAFGTRPHSSWLVFLDPREIVKV